MKYRVKFRFWQSEGHYYTEWFDTLDEAMTFVNRADMTRGCFPILIEDENEDVV